MAQAFIKEVHFVNHYKLKLTYEQAAWINFAAGVCYREISNEAEHLTYDKDSCLKALREIDKAFGTLDTQPYPTNLPEGDDDDE